MKRNQILLTALFIMTLIVLHGCYYDEISPVTTLPENVSFKNDVQPIFDRNCTTSGCHDAVPAHAPSLVSEQSYGALISGNYLNTIDPASSKLYQEIVSGNMPPSGSLSEIDQKIILGWITEGAKDN